MFSSLTTRDHMDAEQQAATIILNQKFGEFKVKAIEIEPLISYKLAKLGFYEAFYPYGATEIHQMTQTNAPVIMDRFIIASTKYKTQIGEDFTITFKNIYDAYQDAVTIQKGLKSSVKMSIPEFELKKIEFFDQIYKNILTIAAFYYKTPEKMLAFFDESLLEVHKHTTADGGEQPYTMEIAPNTTATADFTFSINETILLSNVSDNATVAYYGGETQNAEPVVTPATIGAGEEVEIPASVLGNFLILKNNDTTETAVVEIALLA